MPNTRLSKCLECYISLVTHVLGFMHQKGGVHILKSSEVLKQ